MSESPSDLQGRHALVTGGSRGIGRAIALELARRGAAVVVNYQRDSAAAEAVCAEIAALGGHAVALGADVRQPAEVDRLVATTQESLGPLHVLVNNAGVARDNLLLRMTESEWDDVLDTDLKSAYLCSRAVLRGMLRERWGRIVNISSVIGLGSNPGQANYAAAKAGLLALTRTLAREVGSRGITVNAVAPGFVETDMTEEVPERARERMLARTSLRRPGRPEEIASAVRFLACDGSYVTGQTLVVDGGLSL